MTKKIIKKILITGIALVITCIFGGVIFGLNIPSLIYDKKNSENEKIINVVKLFWNLAEAGKFNEANNLTTNEYDGFIIQVENQEPSEKWINKYDLKHISVMIHQEPKDNKCVVAVKVKGKNREFYLFHDLILINGEWKITTTSY